MLPRSSRERLADLRLMSDGGVGVLSPLPGVDIRAAPPAYQERTLLKANFR